MGWANRAATEDSGSTRSAARLRAGVKARVRTDSAVLLVKEQHCDGSYFWTFPGGGIRPGEGQETALRRELREELDCEVRIRAPAGTVWYAHRSASGLVSKYTVLDCKLTSQPVPNLAEGVHDYRWVPAESLPPRTIPHVRRFV